MSDLSRKADGTLWNYTSVGSYPLVYFCRRGLPLCPACATKHLNCCDNCDHVPVDSAVHWEGPPMACDVCDANIESAYGDPDDDSREQ